MLYVQTEKHVFPK